MKEEILNLATTYRKPLSFLTISLLLVAVLDLPLGYYAFLRIVVFLSALSLAYFSHHQKRPTLALAFVLVAIVFSPFGLIRLSQDTWQILDVISAAIFGTSIFIFRKA